MTTLLDHPGVIATVSFAAIALISALIKFLEPVSEWMSELWRGTDPRVAEEGREANFARQLYHVKRSSTEPEVQNRALHGLVQQYRMVPDCIDPTTMSLERMLQVLDPSRNPVPVNELVGISR